MCIAEYKRPISISELGQTNTGEQQLEQMHHNTLSLTNPHFHVLISLEVERLKEATPSAQKQGKSLLPN